jgi:hypothetical protein
MQFQNKKKLEATDKLSEDKQVVITLNTQREIDQLYAMLNFVPIIEALDTAEGADAWRSLKGFLQQHNYSFWHNRLSNSCSKR